MKATKSKIFLVLILFFHLGSIKAQFPNPVQFNTAINAAMTGSLPVGANDLQWTVSKTGMGGPYVPAIVVGNAVPGSWVNSPFPFANWISYPHTCVGPPNWAIHSCHGNIDEYYKITFNLPATSACGQPINTPGAYCFGFDYYADNIVSAIYVNGILSYSTSVASASQYFNVGFTAGAKLSVSLCNNWQVGSNSVVVLIKSGPPWTGFLAVANQTITPSPIPNIVINNNAPSVCAGSSLTLTASGAQTYTWNPGAISGSAAVINPTANVVYTVTGTSSAGCTASKTVAVIVNPLPVPVANNNGPICLGKTLNLVAGAASGYTWTGPGGFNSSLQNPSIPNISSGAAGVYSLTVMNGMGCKATTTTSVQIFSLPNPAITHNGPLCAGQNINLNGAGGVNYFWTGPNGYSSSSQNAGISNAPTSSSGVYTLTVTDANNCSNFTTANIIVNPLPFIPIVGATACVNQNFNLAAGGGTTYSWAGPNGFNSNLQNPLFTNAAINMSGIYSVTVTDINGCTTTSITSVVVNPLPVPIAGNNGPICANQDLNFISNGGVTYSWNGPGGFISTLQNPSIKSAAPSASGNYTVTVTDSKGCSAKATINVTVNPLPIPNIITSGNKGCAPLCLTFTCTSNGPIQSCNWQFGDGSYSTNSTSASNCFKLAGDYAVQATVTDDKGCMALTTTTLSVYPIPTADFNYAPLHPIINQDADVKFVDASFGATIKKWDWYFMNLPKPYSNQQNPTYLYTEPGQYVIALVVTSDHGCVDTLLKTIIVGEDYGIYVPNSFTPNGDGLNDVFQPKGFGITKYELRIFDRWGEQLLFTNEFTQGWDGIYKGKLSQQGVYVWKINLTNTFGKAHELTGHVTLIK